MMPVMNTSVSAEQAARPYSSVLRDRQVEQTRDLILQALIEQLAEEGIKDFNIPRVARRAGVSVRTIYRYFPTKDALLDAVEAWLDERVLTFPRPQTVDDLVVAPEGQFPIFDQHVPLVLAQLASAAGQAVRARGRRKRLEAYRTALREVTGNLSPAESRAALAVISYLFSAGAWKSFREEFAMSGAESGKAVAWALRALIDDLRRRNEEAGSR